MLAAENFPKHALVCERHVGTGITLDEIKTRNLHLPLREMINVSIEEQIVCYADKFFSKNGGDSNPPQTIETIRRRLARYGDDNVKRFMDWATRFGTGSEANRA